MHTSLMHGNSVLERKQSLMPGGVESEDEGGLLHACNDWAVEQGVPQSEYLYALTDPLSSEPLVVLDLAWPDGLQVEYSQPIAVLLGERREPEEAANRA